MLPTDDYVIARDLFREAYRNNTISTDRFLRLNTKTLIDGEKCLLFTSPSRVLPHRYITTLALSDAERRDFRGARGGEILQACANGMNWIMANTECLIIEGTINTAASSYFDLGSNMPGVKVGAADANGNQIMTITFASWVNIVGTNEARKLLRAAGRLDKLDKLQERQP